jgi:BolA protein
MAMFKNVEKPASIILLCMALRALLPLARGAALKGMATAAVGPVASAIQQKLTATLSPVHLEVHNESSAHNVPPNSETHFKVIVVSDAFEGKKLIERHRLVNETLAVELAGPVHALSIVAKLPAQWAQNSAVDPSPKCLGGSKR